MKIRIAIAMLIAAILACNAPSAQPEPTWTPYIRYITATPDTFMGEALPPATPQVGPFQATRPPDFVEPTLDLSDLTPAAPLPTSSATVILPDQPTATPPQLPDQPTATPTGSASPPVPASPTALPPADLGTSSRLGIAFINGADHVIWPGRLQQGLDAGAGWNRFPIYWYDVELAEDEYTWSIYDEAFSTDVAVGLQTNAILLGVPVFYRGLNGVPIGLNEPVFADGSDTFGTGKAINPDNHWAQWVAATVDRYRPGGVLAQQEGWPAGAGVRVWEVWNEPDLSIFWQGTSAEYARLLKVAYLAINSVYPEAQVMVGGMVIFEQPAFLPEMMTLYKNDPDPVPGRYPFDIMALHAYSHPPYTFYIVQRTESLLGVYGVDVPIWVNESGVPLWDDYPGPTWASTPEQRIWRATLHEQAAYVIQNAAYAFMAETEVLFHFQLYDDCGNQPRGSDFPPHDGGLCAGGAICWGDALGMFRNTDDNVCFTQHPQPGTKRPAYDAFQVVSEFFGDDSLVPLEMFTFNGARWLIFARPDRSELVYVIWNETGVPREAALVRRADQALLVRMDGSRETIQPGSDDLYRIPLPPATNQNAAPGSSIDYMIGGEPVIVVQQTADAYVSVLPLPDASRPAFTVKWRGNRADLTDWQVWYRDDTAGGDWQLWLTPDGPGEALFVGGSGRRYSFFARALGADGEWSRETPEVQASTVTN